MKMVKSLLLGAAAGFIAVAGAQAAALPEKAKPVEFVKVVSGTSGPTTSTLTIERAAPLGGGTMLPMAVVGSYASPAHVAHGVFSTLSTT